MGNLKLGKNAPRRLLSTRSLGDFLDKATTWPQVGPQGWEYAPVPIKLDMLANDTIGDCVIAMAMHYAQNETANTGSPLTASADLAIATYAAITGYDPSQTDSDGNNPTDQGTDIEGQLMPYWKTTGIPMLDANGKEVMHTILGFAALDLTSVPQQRYATYVFGGSLLGIRCPASALQDTTNWTYDPSSPIEGGHGINRVGQGADGGHVNSWGLLIPYTNEFAQKLADEMYIVVTPQWLNAQGESPSGLDLDGLVSAMKAL